jgi:hypothetical protein
MSNEDLTTRARDLARNLSYNDSPLLAATKHTLFELANRLDQLSVRIDPTDNRHVIVDALSRWRFMTWRERVAYRLFKVLPREV